MNSIMHCTIHSKEFAMGYNEDKLNKMSDNTDIGSISPLIDLVITSVQSSKKCMYGPVW